MTANHIDDGERRITRRSVLKAGLVASAVGIGGAATGMAQTDDNSEDTDGDDTHILTVALIESEDADVVSGDVTVDGRTKTTTPVDGDPAIILAEFELEDGTYTVSGTWDTGETWRTNEREVTIDGEDESLSLLLYPPGSDELEDDDDETHTLTVHLVEAEDADIVSGEVTVDGQTKPTTGDDPHYSSADFQLEDGTYTVSGTSDLFPDWRTNEREVTIDGADTSLELYLYPPGSDELEDTEPGDDESQDDSDAGENGSDESGDDESQDDSDADENGSDESGDDDTSDETDTEDTEKSSSSDESGDTDSTDRKQDDDGCP